jgi:hypothetical protein
LGLGELGAAEAELGTYAGQAAELRQPWYRWYALVLRATLATFTGRLEEGERLSREAVTLNRRYEADAEQEHTVQLAMLALARGRCDRADVERLRTFADRYAGLPAWRALSARLELERGDEAAARSGYEELLRDGAAALADERDAIATLSLAAELCAGLADTRAAGELYELLAPHALRNVVFDRGWAAFGAVARRLGRLAALLGRAEAARDHFEAALALERAWGARPWYLRTLIDYADAGGVTPALRDEAAALARELGVTFPRA